MINWDDFEHIHVIDKLRLILNNWWNIDLLFTDEKGHIKGFSGKAQCKNPGTAFLMQKETCRANLSETVIKAVEDLRSTDNRFSIRKWDMVGVGRCRLK